MLNILVNTFREIVRNKFLYAILFFAFVFIVLSISLGKLTIGDDKKIIVDFGLAMIEIFGLVGVLFVGSQLLFKEIDGKTIFLILSKPIARYDFILGKFLGFSATILLIIVAQSLLFLVVLFLKDIEITKMIIFSLLFTFFKLEIVLALVFFFSTFMSNMITIFVTLMIYFVSHSFSLLIDMAMRSKSIIFEKGVAVVQLLFPPFESLNIKDVIGSFTAFHANFYIFNTYYSLAYLSIVLFFTVLIFERKKFEN